MASEALRAGTGADMELADQIQKFKEFFEATYLDELLERLRKAKPYLNVPFPELAKYSPELANILLEAPEDTIKAAQMSLQNIDLQGDIQGFEIRFSDLPSTQRLMLRNIRASHIGRFLQLEGIVRQKSDVRPQVTSARFECPSCGNILPVLQLDQKFREPSRCGCGRKGKFRLLSKQLVDAQKIVLEEAPEDLEGGEQPKRLNILLQKDLVSPLTDRKTNPGSKIVCTGVVKEIPITLATGGQSVRFDLMIDTNFVDAMQEDYTQINISQEEEQEILDFSRAPEPFTRLVNSLAPTIYGHDKIKQALVLQLLGGCRKSKDEGVNSRGDIHILLIGDPGAGKSQLLKRVSAVAPKARFVSGKGASGAGLTASVVKDEFLRGWALEAGALVLANRGVCCIDELDKMTDEDRSAMHEALEQQTVTISKANIQATLRSETTVLAAANPKFGRFDPYEMLAKQIDLPSTLINRFDLIFPIRDMPDQENDQRLAHFILKLHQKETPEEAELSPEFIRKYLSYARTRVRPILTNEALEELENYYVKMRSSGEGDTIKAIPISARQLEALVRLAEASAKVRLSKTVEREDAKVAIDLVYYCLSQIGMDPETGKIDIDRITTGVSAKQRSNIHIIKDIIGELVATLGDTPIPIEDLVRECELKGVSEKEVEEVLEKLKRSGDVYSPKQGFISRI
jgi:replicative DNA helicase Mcm